MAFYHFKNLNLSLNGNTIIPSEIQLESQVDIVHPLILDDRTSKKNTPSSPYFSSLKIKYFLTGQDYLKPYLYSLENETITGNFCGLIFNQSYISDYSVTFAPNSPIEISTSLSIFDKISGVFTPLPPTNVTGALLRTSDVVINNVSNYTSTVINNIIQAVYTYNCKLNPSYTYDSGTLDLPLRADRVSIEDRKWDLQLVSDSVGFDIPLSGEQFALTISGVNPYNNLINESFSASGVISYKQFNISNNSVHSHVLKLSQSHSNSVGGISQVLINSNTFNVYSTPFDTPFTNNFLNSIDKIVVGDTVCPSFSTQISGGTTQILTVNIPSGIINGSLSIYTSKGNLFWPSTLQFSYPSITITGISQNSGYPGTPIYISGNNFYRISQVNFGTTSSTFQTISPNLILAIVPNNGVTSDIQLISDLRSLTGYTSSFFYCQPSISLLTPLTGVWNDPLVIGGQNFSGTTAVQFGTGNINASSFSIQDNDTILVHTPGVGAGYPEGYVNVITSGGSTQSFSRYLPQVPITSFSGASGLINSIVYLTMTIDSGYLFSTGGGYKVRAGGVDTIFYQNGSILSGNIPVGAQSDYFYIYKPDGVSTYTPNGTEYIVHATPDIFSITPAITNQFQYINPVIVGDNFNSFSSNLNYFYAFSGGINGDMQFGKTIMSNSGGNSDTIYIPNLQITGGTGYYDVLIRNLAGTGIFKSGLLVKSGINQAQNCKANLSNANFQLGGYFPSLAIDNSTGTFAGIKCTTNISGASLNLVPKNNNLLTLSTIRVFVNTGSVNDDVTNRGNGSLYIATTTGSLSLWYKNANKPFFDTSMVDFSNPTNNVINFISPAATGVAAIKIFVPAAASVVDFRYLGVSEIQMY